MKTLATGIEACVIVTLLDGLVLARSAFHHSMNYRSAMVFGRADAVTDPDEKRAAVTALVEHIVPGRSAGTRGPSDSELRATLVVRLPLDEASAKVRTGPPIDDPEDLDLPYWAGVIPLALVASEPEPDAHTALLRENGSDGEPAGWPRRRFGGVEESRGSKGQGAG